MKGFETWCASNDNKCPRTPGKVKDAPVNHTWDANCHEKKKRRQQQRNEDKDENEKEKDKEQMGASPAQQKDMVCFCCGKKKAIVLMNVQTQTKHQKPNGHARKAHKCTFRKLKKIQMKKRKTTMMKTKANLWKTNQEPDGTTWCVVLVVHRNTGKWIAKKMQFWALAQHSVLSRTRNCCTTSRKQEAKSKCR